MVTVPMKNRSDPPAQVPDGWRVFSYLVGGIVVYTAIGFGLDRLFHTSWLLPTGIVIGATLSVLLVYFRFRE